MDIPEPMLDFLRPEKYATKSLYKWEVIFFHRKHS